MVHIFDTFQLGRPKIIAVTALETQDGIALFDVGPESTWNNVVREMAAVGIAQKDVRHVFLSHIHFDHAGAAWRLAQTGATIYVHPKGAPHLIDPSRLVESATRIYGDRMQELWGTLGAIPQERVRIAQDGDTFRAGQFDVRAVDTPGHANHHNIYAWDDNVFGGDVAGVTINGGPVIPPFVPPELHLESWLQSIHKLRALRPARFYLPHWGLVEGGIEAHLDQLEARLHDWAGWFRRRLKEGADEPTLVREFEQYEADDLRRNGRDAQGVKDYELADPSFMAVSASIRYWNKYHPEEIRA